MEYSDPGLSWFMSNTIISYESHLITTQFRSGFYIYILERSFCLMLYNIAMIQHYSRCVIRQLLWLRSTYPNVLFRLGFYMCSPQELSAHWLLWQAHDRGATGAREHITRESPDNALRHILLGPWGTRGILMYKVFPRNLYSTECHSSKWKPFVILKVHSIERSYLFMKLLLFTNMYTNTTCHTHKLKWYDRQIKNTWHTLVI